MKTSILISFLFICLFSKAQNEAYYISEGGFDLIKFDLDSQKIINYYSFLDTVVEKKNQVQTPFNLSDNFSSKQNLILKDSSKIVKSPIYAEIQSSNSPFYKIINDSISLNNSWYKIEIIQTDDHFVGGRPNRVTTNITVKELGLIYSHSNEINAHTNIMICHQDSTKQNLLTSAFEYIEKNHPSVIEKTYLTRIIRLTKEYDFNNLVDILSEKWLAPRQDLKLTKTHSETINGQINYTVTIKNISDKGYYFLWGSEFGPSKIEQPRNDKRIISKIEGAYHGARYHFNFEKVRESIYLSPGEEMDFNLKPNMRENCVTCDQYKYFGFQVYRYGVDFFYWIFSEEIEHNGLDYTLYHLIEIK